MLKSNRAPVSGWIAAGVASLLLVRRSSFDAAWVPRIGERGAEALRHNNYVRLITVPWIFGAALAFVLLIQHGTLDVVLGVAAVATTPVAFRIQLRSLHRYAAALSQWFGIEMNRRDIPRRAGVKGFDNWCHQRGLEPATPRRTEPPD